MIFHFIEDYQSTPEEDYYETLIPTKTHGSYEGK